MTKIEELVQALLNAEEDKKVIVFNFTKTELEYANRKWIIYEEGKTCLTEK